MDPAYRARAAGSPPPPTEIIQVPDLRRRAKAFARATGMALATGGSAVLVGWLLGLRPLTSVVEGWPTMAPSTALLFLLLGWSIFVYAATGSPPLGWHLRASRAAAWIVLGFAIFRLVCELLGRNWGLDLFPLGALARGIDWTHPTGMAPASALAFGLLAGALLLPRPEPRTLPLFQTFTLLALLIALLSCGRYIFGGKPLLPLAQMALHTTVFFVAASLGVLGARAEGGLAGLLVEPGRAGHVVRRLLPPALILPFLIGWLRLRGERAGLYDLEAGISLFALAFVVLFSLLAWSTAASLASSERARRLADRKILLQLARLDLLQQITRAIAERHDLRSIYQVVVRSVEDHLPVDFCCICLYDRTSHALEMSSLGTKAAGLDAGLAAPEPIDPRGFERCLSGQVLYEPDLAQLAHSLARRLAACGLRSLTAIPLQLEDKAFGILIAARGAEDAFTAGECEFLRQLGEHVALASHQMELREALQLAYNDLRQTQHTVMQQERLRALGQMTSGIAHDINNSIAPIGICAEGVLETEALSERGRANLEIILRAIHDVAQTVARLQEFYRQRDPSQRFVQVQLNPLVEQVLELTRSRWRDMPQQGGRTIQIVRRLEPDLPEIAGTENELRDALINLVFNAVDAMPEGGTLALTTRCTHASAQILDNGSLCPMVCLEIADSGTGMDEATRRRCLEPFFTTKGERGTGLGLPMVFGIAERHHAEIEIESEPERGTTVRLLFPLPSPATLPAAPPAPLAAASSLRLLVVEDDPILLPTLTELFEREGHEVVAANGGRAGIDAFHVALQEGHPFDLVLTDLGMPEIDGRRVAAEVKEASPRTPVILLTGWGQSLNAEGDHIPHVDRVLSKPPRLRDLREALRDSLAPP
jgi:signal transduction histidine kinase/ActR/RegA family two-component response regulator